MHSLKSLFIYSVLFLVVSCSSSVHEHVMQTFEDGNPKLVHFYKMNSVDSVLLKEVQYYSGGHKKVEGTYKNDKRDGAWTFWFENGTVWSEGFFTQDVRSGKTLVYHENGAPFYEGVYQEGKKHGVWIFYNQMGEKVNEITFDSGTIKNQKPSKQ